MRLKFQNVDVEACLRTVMEQNTKYYQTDFEYDKESFLHAAKSDQAADKRLFWMSRHSGTWCVKEHDIFIRESEAFHIWHEYKGSTDPIIAFTVEVTGMENGRVMGDLFTQDYPAILEHIDHTAFTAATAFLRFEDDDTLHQFPYDEYEGHSMTLYYAYGKITECRLEPEDPAALQTILKQEQALRRKYIPGDFSAYMAKQFSKEKESVSARLKEAAHTAVKQPDKDNPPLRKTGPER